MRRPGPIVAVITADIIASSNYSPAERRRLDRILRTAFRDTERRFRNAMHTKVAFRITAGDEFQVVVRDVGRVFDILTYVRALAASGDLTPPARFRASVGIGEASVLGRKSPYEEDGAAFVRSRRGLEQLTGKGGVSRWTKLQSGNRETDEAAEAVLSLADYLFEKWTVPQWEAARWTILGLKRQETARRLRIAHQNVSKRLRAAGWPYLEPALHFLRELHHSG